MSKNSSLIDRVGRMFRRGTGLPTHAEKQEVLRHYARQHGLKVLVESGTCHGDMVEAMRDEFTRIFSVELSPEFHAGAARRFAGVPHIEIILGDSATALSGILERVKEPILFWLDGHYSGGNTARGANDTPVFEELTQIYRSGEKRHVVLIDDARLFGTDPAYPTLVDLETFARKLNPGVKMEVAGDAIRLTTG
jgi:hypothetical protein